MPQTIEMVRADYESLREQFEIIRRENVALKSQLNEQAKRETTLRDLANAAVSYLPDCELDLARSIWGNTNTSLVRRSVGLLSLFLGRKRFFDKPEPYGRTGYIPRDDDREWVEQKARELGIEIVEEG